MYYRFILTVLLSVSFVFFSGCESNPTGTGDKEGSTLSDKEITQAAKKLAEADHAFSLDIFKEVVAQDDNENVFLSPLSISMALGMCLNGAKGETYDEIRETLALQELELPEINEGYKYLMENLTTIDPKVQMEIANSVWAHEGFEVEEAFMQALQDYFEAEARELDFSDPEAVDTINGWISDKTHDKINKMLDRIPPDAVMYLINAVYFNGSWKYSFDPDDTREESFILENGETVQAEMMRQQNHFAHYISDEVQMIDVPYGDSLFTMTLLMPNDASVAIDDFIANDITRESLENWYDQLSADTVGLVLPKLELEYKILLNDVLDALGMQVAFGGYADFSGINREGGLSISRVLHNTYLNMDEEGTEAAGVTVVEFVRTSVGPEMPVIRFARPYIMILREQSTGTILFTGKIKNPTL